MTSFIHNKKKLLNKQTLSLNWIITARKHLNYYKHRIHVPFKWSVLILQRPSNYYLYFYTQNYFICTPIPNFFSNLTWDINTSTLQFYNIKEKNFTNLYLNLFYKLLSLMNNPSFLKLKFKGKGYYIYKNLRNTITPQFGFSHRHYVYAPFIKVNFRTKTSIILFGLSTTDIIRTGNEIRNLRYINIFTNRGVRFNRQIIYKKAGKVSSYR